MVDVIAFLASSVIALHSPAHYVVDLTATQDVEILATSHLLVESSYGAQFVQQDRGQRLTVKVNSLSGKDKTNNFSIYIEASSRSGEVVRKVSRIFSLNDDRHFVVDVEAMGDQPAMHFDFTVNEDSVASARPS